MTFHAKLQEIFTDNYPILTFKEHMDGPTNYLDGIYPDDMSDSIMSLVDHHGRKGLAIKVIVRERFNEIIKQNKETYEGCLTLSTLHKNYIKNNYYNKYIPVEISRNIETYLKEDTKKFQFVITFHERYIDNNNLYVIAESSNPHKWGLLNLDSMRVIEYDGSWSSQHNKYAIQSLANNTHPTLRIV